MIPGLAPQTQTNFNSNSQRSTHRLQIEQNIRVATQKSELDIEILVQWSKRMLPIIKFQDKERIKEIKEHMEELSKAKERKSKRKNKQNSQTTGKECY